MIYSKLERDPPFIDRYGPLFDHRNAHRSSYDCESCGAAECELPLIDLSALRGSGVDDDQRRACMDGIAKAASEWGFFQVVNHGVNQEILEEMRREQVKVFEMPFEKKVGCRLLNDSYRWGTPTATSVEEFSWSEAFHIPLSKISEEGSCSEEFSSLR